MGTAGGSGGAGTLVRGCGLARGGGGAGAGAGAGGARGAGGGGAGAGGGAARPSDDSISPRSSDARDSASAASAPPVAPVGSALFDNTTICDSDVSPECYNKLLK